ncbi:MAG TPA: class I SAM-dependent methyltransferase [Steroidobacteraceae bacterium]|nr:class I SAM-dependent methyltransferase [Steroidobacteraceae bacterium]
MSTLTSPVVNAVIDRLYADAEKQDRPLRESFEKMSPEERKRIFESQQADYRALYERMSSGYLAIPREFGTFVYLLARARNAKTLVEFGTSFGLSTIHLAAALRDNGGGRVVTTEFIESKAATARQNLEAAGLADLVEIRPGDALQSLAKGVGAPIDFVLLDGAKNLYVPILKLLEPHLAARAVIAADNTTDDSPHVLYVRNPANGYVSVGVPYPSGNEMSVWAGR